MEKCKSYEPLTRRVKAVVATLAIHDEPFTRRKLAQMGLGRRIRKASCAHYS